MPPHFFLVALLASVLLDMLLPYPDFVEPGLRWSGSVPVLIGFWIAVSSSQRFAAAGTTIRPFERSTSLVTGGWFRWSRNPMYLSMIVILLGVGILLGSLQAFPPALILAPVLHYGFIRREEAMLTAEFGVDYEQYRSRVRRWL